MQSPAESSLSTLFESYHVFDCDFLQIQRNKTFRSTVDVFPIRFRWNAVYANYNTETGQYDREPPVKLRIKTLKLRYSRGKASWYAKTRMERFARYTRVITRSPREANKLRNKLGRYLLRAMRLTEDTHSLIIDDIVSVLQAKLVDPDKVLEVLITEVIFRDTEESMLSSFQYFEGDEEYYRAKLIPAPKSFIQGLEEVSPPDDELECAICLELFAQKKDSSITQLPCSHYYHQDCIVPWLKINHACPTCRRPNTAS